MFFSSISAEHTTTAGGADIAVYVCATNQGAHTLGSDVCATREKEHKQNKPVLFLIRLDDAVMETEQAWASNLRRTRHIGDFRAWKDHDPCQKSFERLRRDLKA